MISVVGDYDQFSFLFLKYKKLLQPRFGLSISVEISYPERTSETLLSSEPTVCDDGSVYLV